DDAVRPLVQRHRRTDRDAGRVGAMVAAQHGEVAPRVRELALLDILDPGAERAHRHVVLGLARQCTGMAADALAVVDDEPELGQDPSSGPAWVERGERTRGKDRKSTRLNSSHA